MSHLHPLHPLVKWKIQSLRFQITDEETVLLFQQFWTKGEGQSVGTVRRSTDLCELSFRRVEVSLEDRTSRISASHLIPGTSHLCGTDFHPVGTLWCLKRMLKFCQFSRSCDKSGKFKWWEGWIGSERDEKERSSSWFSQGPCLSLGKSLSHGICCLQTKYLT